MNTCVNNTRLQIEAKNILLSILLLLDLLIFCIGTETRLQKQRCSKERMIIYRFVKKTLVITISTLSDWLHQKEMDIV